MQIFCIDQDQEIFVDCFACMSVCNVPIAVSRRAPDKAKQSTNICWSKQNIVPSRLGCANKDLWALCAPIFIIVIYCR